VQVPRRFRAPRTDVAEQNPWHALTLQIGQARLLAASKGRRCAVEGCRIRKAPREPVCLPHWRRHVAPHGISLMPSMVMERARWTSGMALVAGYASRLLERLVGSYVRVRFVREIALPASALYRRGRAGRRREVVLNIAVDEPWAALCAPTVAKMRGRARLAAVESLHDVLVHEAAHEKAWDHGEGFVYALSEMAGKMALLLMRDPADADRLLGPSWFRLSSTPRKR
jgi:hypothetical protein